jgi:hypothetical protein
MKTKIFALFAAMMLLVGTTAMAQSGDTKTSKTTETEIKGDVNNDGVVDVADIAAVIAVMHEQGTVAPQYYWYVGKTKPTTSTNPESEKATADNTMGWHLIGASFNADDYHSGNMLHRGAGAGTINIDPEYNDVEYYIALPVGIGIYNGFGQDITSNYTLVSSSITIAGVIYNVYSDFNSEFGAHIY